MRRNVRLGMLYGLALAALYSTYAGLLRLVQGPEVFHSPEFSMITLVGAYFTGGAVAGVLVGLLLPVGRTQAGAALLGLVGAVPAVYAVGMVLDPPEKWLSETLVTALITAVLLGPLCGLGAWHVHRRIWR